MLAAVRPAESVSKALWGVDPQLSRIDLQGCGWGKLAALPEPLLMLKA